MARVFRSTRDVIIRTPALAEAVQFYQAVLGLSAVRHGDTLYELETGAFCLYVEQGPAHGPVFEFLVANIAAAKEQLIAAGCTLVEEDLAMPRCYLRDPYGVVFNVGQAAS